MEIYDVIDWMHSIEHLISKILKRYGKLQVIKMFSRIFLSVKKKKSRILELDDTTSPIKLNGLSNYFAVFVLLLLDSSAIWFHKLNIQRTTLLSNWKLLTIKWKNSLHEITSRFTISIEQYRGHFLLSIECKKVSAIQNGPIEKYYLSFYITFILKIVFTTNSSINGMDSFWKYEKLLVPFNIEIV